MVQRYGSVAVMHNVPDQPLGHLAMSHARPAQDIHTTMFMTLPSISTWAVSAPSVCSTWTVTTGAKAVRGQGSAGPRECRAKGVQGPENETVSACRAQTDR